MQKKNIKKYELDNVYKKRLKNLSLQELDGAHIMDISIYLHNSFSIFGDIDTVYRSNALHFMHTSVLVALSIKEAVMFLRSNYGDDKYNIEIFGTANSITNYFHNDGYKSLRVFIDSFRFIETDDDKESLKEYCEEYAKERCIKYILRRFLEKTDEYIKGRRDPYYIYRYIKEGIYNDFYRRLDEFLSLIPDQKMYEVARVTTVLNVHVSMYGLKDFNTISNDLFGKTYVEIITLDHIKDTSRETLKRYSDYIYKKSDQSHDIDKALYEYLDILGKIMTSEPDKTGRFVEMIHTLLSVSRDYETVMLFNYILNN